LFRLIFLNSDIQAINSEDTDLIYYTLISLESRFSDSSFSETPAGSKALRDAKELFYKTISTHLEAANLLKIYYRNKVTVGDRKILHNLLLHNKYFFEAGS
jgi:hypothetical protein